MAGDKANALAIGGHRTSGAEVRSQNGNPNTINNTNNYILTFSLNSNCSPVDCKHRQELSRTSRTGQDASR